MKRFLLPAAMLAASLPSMGQYSHVVNADNLGRGLVAVKTDTGVFVSWRSLAEDDKNVAFDVYRDGTKINSEPLTRSTCFTDAEGTADSKYSVKAIVNDNVVETSREVTPWDTFYKKIHLDRPEGGTSPAGGSKEDREYTYTPDDVSVGDVDGDGEFEYIVKWFPTNQADNGDQFRYTGNTLLDCYKLDGTKLWRIDLGQNIRSGNHYTQFMVYDFDQDGKAELICKTAPGTIDGQGKAVLLGEDQVTDDYREKSGSLAGVVKSGPEYLTVFNGLTGAEINTIYYNPPRDIQAHSKSGWGDANGNRCERYLAGVAYLHEGNPSAVFVRGYYTHCYVWAVDFNGKELKEHWLHTSDKAGQGMYGEGTHSLTVGDVDADGFDEIIIGSGAVDHDGTLLHRTGGGHGDALHLADMLPDREGLEVFMPHEEKGSSYKYDVSLRDARTGEILYYLPQSGNDIGRGLAANVSSKYPGYEYWSTANGNVYNAGVAVGSSRPSVNFRIYWDGDLLDELLDGSQVTKPKDDLSGNLSLMNFANYSNATSCNGTKKTPNLQADLFGDWREEVILHDNQTQSDLIIFTTTTPTEYRVPCLMQDRQYREAVAWQNVAYNQPPHLSYNLESLFDTHARIVVSSGNMNQMIFAGEEITPIEFYVARATDAVVSGLPEGLSFTFDKESLTGIIEGTPTQEGEYEFTITTSGAEDGTEATLTGVVNVRAKVETTLTELARFSFDEVGATVANHVTGEATVAKGNVVAAAGMVNGAAEFDGKTYLTQPVYDALQVADGDFTIELWMNSTDDDGYLFCIGTHNTTNVAGGTGNWIGLEKASSRFTFSIDDNVTKSDVNAADMNCFDGKWHHIVCVRNAWAGSTSIYIDGKLSNENTGVGTGAIKFSDSELFFIGGDDEPTSGKENRTFNGLLDELTVYSGALTPSEVKERYDSVMSSGVETIVIEGENVNYTIVDAFSGLIVGTAVNGNLDSVMTSLVKGIYIIVSDNGSTRKAYKFRKN